MEHDENLNTAAECRHYAMCKIDYLGTGLCQSGVDKGYVSYFPQGRMDLYHALAQNQIPVTQAAVDIADTCNLCGICDKQCCFITGLRPLKVMRALKGLVDKHRRDQQEVMFPSEDEFLSQLRNITGVDDSTHDPAIRIAYSNDPCPLTEPMLPRYVSLPSSANQVSEIIRLCREVGMEYSVRGNGSSVMGFVMSTGLVIDTVRMKGIDIDKKNWCVTVGPGVSSFELQQAVKKEGMRVNAAEPSALVCANIMCSGIFSLFSAAYGINADNIVTARFVDPEGNQFSLHEQGSDNLFAYQKADQTLPAICVEATVKMHPVEDDEEGILVPFRDLNSALGFSGEISRRRLGIAVGILGGEYISTFLSPNIELARDIKDVFSQKLGIAYLVLVIGDKYTMRAIREMEVGTIDGEMFRTVFKGLKGFSDPGWTDLIGESDGGAYEFLTDRDMLPLVGSVLDSSEESLGSCFPEDLRDFFTQLYKDDNLTDLIWLNEFRILSSRMGREKHVFAIIVYVPMDPEIIEEMNNGFKEIGDKHGVKHDYGFITPVDCGKRAVFEYDFYLDHRDPDQIIQMRETAGSIAQMIGHQSARHPEIKWIRYTLYQGFARKEHILYID